MRNLATFLALAVSIPTMASAETDDWMQREFTTPEIAADLAYGLCPLLLSDQLDLATNHLLKERGFSGEVTVKPNAAYGEISEVSTTRPDSTIYFGGTPGKLCNVTVNGASRDEALARLRSDMSFMGIDLQPDVANSGTFGGTKIEAFAGPIESQVLHLQLGVADASVIAQLYVTDE